MLALVLSFFGVALLYATVGFGGGSSYIALLAVNQIPYTLIPKISLLCNLLVVINGAYLFHRRGHVRWDLALPLVCSSVPFSILGGLYPIQEHTFLILLSSCLLLAGVRILFIKNSLKLAPSNSPGKLALVLTGAFLGALSGMVGIGGGIFLSPVMLDLNWARAKEVAAISSLFILLNSIGGLGGQIVKSPDFPSLNHYFILFLAVILGGQLGSRIGTHSKIPHLWIQRGTGVLILMVSGRLFLKLFRV